mmetsp:Transcript_25248/g.45704  ORF Transcript_25248/g.45704 Transcript_25248/m.45704 type:complete len:100 (+) Transcript_25248:37-336(+)
MKACQLGCRWMQHAGVLGSLEEHVHRCSTDFQGHCRKTVYDSGSVALLQAKNRDPAIDTTKEDKPQTLTAPLSEPDSSSGVSSVTPKVLPMPVAAVSAS